jgi:hypothetical protein
MSEIRQLKSCGLYLPGHQVHWIQARLERENQENRPDTGRVVDVRNDGAVGIDLDGEERRLWNHQPDRLAEAASQSALIVRHQPTWGLLQVGNTVSGYLFCDAGPSNEHVPCLDRPRVGVSVSFSRAREGSPSVHKSFT